MFRGRKPIIGAPYWYNTPLDELDFEWTTEEKLEIERYCEKILKNIEAEGGMTPRERWNACLWGKDKDRMLMAVPLNNVYTAKTLDSAADAMKPIDLYQYPKLWIKSHLATVARFGLDYPTVHNINYGEDMWGGQSRMIEYGNPILDGKPPITCLEDLEGMPIPDPRKDGLYPGYLWANRELRRIFDEYKLPLPQVGSICPGPTLLPMMGMLGWTEFTIGLRKNPELVRKCMDISNEFLIGFGKAFIDEVAPDSIYM
ncbi:MAG: hypothetical protein EPO21_07955 [Chloroflexota bacterium]|nr:MAG: hypothetical protein EPO21_07955 [Chloroflexota bacterium]